MFIINLQQIQTGSIQFISDNNFNCMDLADFSHNYKYKFIIPFIYIASWVFMFIGPLMMPLLYQKICIGLIFYLTTKSLMLLIISIIAYFKSRVILNRAEQMQLDRPLADSSNQPCCKEVYHAFIIPNYKEDEEMLGETMDRIAMHQGAKANYMVFLAMEAHEEHSDLKAERLMGTHQHKFLLMGYTQHQLREYEQRGKASNVSWCVEHLEEKYFKPRKIPIDKILLTIIDADSWVPEVYSRELEDHLVQPTHLPQRERYIYQSNQIFTRNHLDVPIITRTYDQVHGGMHSNNLLSLFNISFPLSNYSLHFSLAKRIGWWDTCSDAIGQDFHMTEKAFWKTDGDIECVPIYAPFNQVNIQTGKGVIEDVKARFWQAERHARGVSDVPYNINMLINRPARWRTFIVAYHVLECFIMPALIPWALTAMTYQTKVLYQYSRPSPELISEDLTGPMFTFNTICLYGSYFFYWLLKRRATDVLYGLEKESVLRILEYPIIFFVNTFGITLPCYVIAAFGALFEGREYVVAEKVIKKDGP